MHEVAINVQVTIRTAESQPRTQAEAPLEEWSEWVMRDRDLLEDTYANASPRFREALSLLAAQPSSSMTYDEIDETLGWHSGCFRSVFGGWRSRRGTRSLRPFHLCSSDASTSGKWEAWVDAEQAEVFSNAAITAG